MGPLASALGVSPQELLILFAQGQSRPGLGRKNKNTMKTKTNISGYILRSSAAALLFLCVVVALSSATNPKLPTSQNNTAFGVNGHGTLPSGGVTPTPTPACIPNDYTITTGSGTIVPGIIDTGNHADEARTPIALPFPVTFYDQTFFSVVISSNGNLQFTGASDSDFANGCPLPAGWVIDLIAPYWQDLYDADIAAGQGVFTSVSGTTPSRIFNIEFRENLCCSPGTPLLDFEVRLHEDTPNACSLTSSMPPDAPRPRLHQRRRHRPLRAITMSRRLTPAASFLGPPTQATIAMIVLPLLRSHSRSRCTGTPLPLRTSPAMALWTSQAHLTRPVAV
ncbi:MAG: hypothetical protein DMF11_12920 [Verrucomicrobia bacterium]|nr:MAG: hypothetical protein DMF11_12920 [Verrucomicrobiota bacterium]